MRRMCRVVRANADRSLLWDMIESLDWKEFLSFCEFSNWRRYRKNKINFSLNDFQKRLFGRLLDLSPSSPITTMSLCPPSFISPNHAHDWHRLTAETPLFGQIGLVIWCLGSNTQNTSYKEVTFRKRHWLANSWDLTKPRFESLRVTYKWYWVNVFPCPTVWHDGRPNCWAD